jgi:hypothetical protein
VVMVGQPKHVSRFTLKSCFMLMVFFCRTDGRSNGHSQAIKMHEFRFCCIRHYMHVKWELARKLEYIHDLVV